jgi:hypothetical protein
MEEIMKRVLMAAILTASLLPASSSAVELKNIRPCYGPLGATRYDTKLLPGDVLFMTFDIEGLVLDPKTGKTSYVTILELIDAKQQVLFKKETPNEVVPQLGGTRMPGDLHIIMGPKQAPGRYSLRLTVHDKFGNDAKAFKYDFDVVPESFGMVAVTASCIGFPGQHYVPGFALVNLAVDAKKQPNVEVSIKILDQSGTPVAPAMQLLLPRDMPENTDLDKANFVPLTVPVYLNRVGRYTMEITAIDKLANKKTELRYPFNVIDISGYTK